MTGHADISLDILLVDWNLWNPLVDIKGVPNGGGMTINHRWYVLTMTSMFVGQTDPLKFAWPWWFLRVLDTRRMSSTLSTLSSVFCSGLLKICKESGWRLTALKLFWKFVILDQAATWQMIARQPRPEHRAWKGVRKMDVVNFLFDNFLPFQDAWSLNMFQSSWLGL